MGLCKNRDCSMWASFGFEGISRAVSCRKHKTADMVCVRRTLCAHEGCYKHPFFGVEGTKKGTACSKHRTEGMVDVMSKRCAYQGCLVRPAYGAQGSKKGEFCTEHKSVGMVNVRNGQCAHEGCSVRPSFGTQGKKKAVFCGKHRITGMVNVRNKKCARNGCSVRAIFGWAGTRVAELCSPHKISGMVDIYQKKCAEPGCSKRPSYGTEGSKNAVYCSEHKMAGMLNVVKKTCAIEGCDKCAAYPQDGSKQQRQLCFRHFRGIREAAASTVEASITRPPPEEMGEEAGGQVFLPNARKRYLTVESFQRNIQKVSAPVREPSPPRSPSAFTPTSLDGTDQFGALLPWPFPRATSSPTALRGSASKNIEQGERATSGARRRSTHSRSLIVGRRDVTLDSRSAARKSAQPVILHDVVGASARERNVIFSAETMDSGDPVHGGSGCDGLVETEDPEALTSSRCVGTGEDHATTPTHGRRHTGALCAFACGGVRTIASLEEETREVVVETEAREMISTRAPEGVGRVMEEGHVDDNIGLCGVNKKRPGRGGIIFLGEPDTSTATVKFEG